MKKPCNSPTAQYSTISAVLQVPIWQLAGPSYSYTSREQRKHHLAALEAQQQQQQRGRLSGGAIAGIVIAVVGSAVMAAAAVLAVMVRRRGSIRDGKVRCMYRLTVLRCDCCCSCKCWRICAAGVLAHCDAVTWLL
jgi:hypothetical protein